MYICSGHSRRKGLGLTTHSGCKVKNKEFATLENMMADKETNAKDIIEYFQKIHPTKDVQDFHYKALEDSFLCLAAMHDRVAVFQRIQPIKALNEEGFMSYNNPLLVAVYHRNIELIQMLVTAGYHADQSAFIFKSIFSSKMENAIDYVIAKDDVEVMKILRPALHETNIKKLLKMANSHRAAKCFLAILQDYDQKSEELDLNDVYKTALTLDVNVLEEMVRTGFHNFTRNETGTDVTSTERSQMFATLSDYLISLGAKAYKFDSDGHLPLDSLISRLHVLSPVGKDDVADHERHCQHFLDMTRTLLRAMRKEKPEQEILIPRYTAATLQYIFYDMLRNIKTNAQVNVDVANLSLDACVQMLEMVLATGVDISNDEQEVYQTAAFHNIARPPTDASWQKLCDPSHPTLFYNRSGWVTFEELLENSWNLDAYEDKIIRFNILQLVYGTKPDSTCFRFLACLLELNREGITTGLIQPILSLMSQELIKHFRKYVEQINADQNKNIDTSILSSFYKSIMETSRMVTYDSIKDRRMASHAHSLPLPTDMKKFFCLDYEFKKENSEGLGKCRVEQLCESLGKM